MIYRFYCFHVHAARCAGELIMTTITLREGDEVKFQQLRGEIGRMHFYRCQTCLSLVVSSGR